MTILLELDVGQGVIEELPSDPLERLAQRRRLSLAGIIERLGDAVDDERVVGLLAKVDGGNLSLAMAQELAQAVERFRSGGRRAIAFAESFGELAHGTSAYLLAVSFDEVWLQPSGDVGLTGVSASAVFVRGALDRGHVEPLFAQRYEYKNAADSLMRHELSEPHREAMGRLVESTYEQVVATVARGRKLTEKKVRQLIDRAPIPAQEARKAGLVDQLGYWDEVRTAVRSAFGPAEPVLTYVARYRPRLSIQRVLRTRRPGVGLIRATGPIRTGRSRHGPGGTAVGSDTIAAAFRAAVKDEHIKAIVFRINSPGGSYVASDTIWREVSQARRAGLPVIVSMGAVAGSGGYFVSMGADVIVAQPSTLTGSIGVLGGKFDAQGLFERFGIRVEGEAAGAHARMFSPQTGFTDADWEKLNAWLDAVYEDFTAKVAEGRRMTKREVDGVARGRVWTGADAAQRGLVDELGGLTRALSIAREKATLPPDAPVRSVPSPSPLRSLRRPTSSDDPAAASLGQGADITLGALVDRVTASLIPGLAGVLAPLGAHEVYEAFGQGDVSSAVRMVQGAGLGPLIMPGVRLDP